jgi:hypothetical protein
MNSSVIQSKFDHLVVGKNKLALTEISFFSNNVVFFLSLFSEGQDILISGSTGNENTHTIYSILLFYHFYIYSHVYALIC